MERSRELLSIRSFSEIKKMLVYLITNTVNNKLYVGQTSQSLLKRWSSHGSDAKRNRGPNALVHAFKKYGKENFTCEAIHLCESKEEMDFVEMFYIVLLS